MTTTVTYEASWLPRVVLTRTEVDFQATIEVDGLDVQREVSSEELGIGILSLEPPTVSATNHRDLIALCQRALYSAIVSSSGEHGGPGAVLMGYLKAAIAVRQALRKLGEDI